MSVLRGERSGPRIACAGVPLSFVTNQPEVGMLFMNDWAPTTLIRPPLGQNEAATLAKQNAELRRHVDELRALLPVLRAEAAELREENAWQKRWIKELREAVAALTGSDAA